MHAPMTSEAEVSLRPSVLAPYRPLLLVLVLMLLTLGALIAGNGNIAVALAPSVGFVVLYALCKLPLRIPVFGLIIVGFMFQTDNGALAGHYQPGWLVIGQPLLQQLKHTIPVGALVFTGFDVALIFLFLLYAYRRATRSRIDWRDGEVAMPLPLMVAAWSVLAGCGVVFIWGLLNGGSFRFALWQIQALIRLPLVFLLLQFALPRPGAYRQLAVIILATACFRSLLAIYLRGRFPGEEYATSHSDSMSFAVATCILVIGAFEIRSRSAIVTALTLLPLLVWGMIANDRRLVWAELGFALAIMLLFTKRNRLKVRLLRGVLYGLLAAMPYVAVGWGSGSPIFRPVATLRSMVDSKSDASTMWRDLENINLVKTLAHHPVMGLGLGRPYEIDIPFNGASIYELEPYLPHNSVLGLWAYYGYVGFALIWMFLAVTVYFSIRTYRRASKAADRVAALVSFCAVVIYMVHLYGDMALGTWGSAFLIGGAMVVSGKLAVVVGAWPGRVRAPATSRASPPEQAERSSAAPEHVASESGLGGASA